MTTILHSDKCECLRCQVANFKEPEIKYTSYRTKTATMTLERIEYIRGSWMVYFEVAHDGYHMPENRSWHINNWNKYSTQWNEGNETK